MKKDKLNKHISIIATIAGLLLGGCSTTGPSMADIAKDQAHADKVRESAEDARLAKQQAALAEEAKTMPEWVIQVPPTDEKGFYAVGQGDSESLRVSMEKAKLDGEFGLAEQFKNSISGQLRHSDKEGLMGHQEEFSRLVDNLISEVSVSGYEVIHQDVRPINGRFRAYILVRLPFNSINRVLREQDAKTSSVEIKQDYSDMFARIDKKQKEAHEQAAEQSAQSAAKQTATQAQSAPPALPATTATPSPAPITSIPLNASKGPADNLPLDEKL